MKTANLSALFARIDAAEYGLCRRMNRASSHVALRNTFRVASPAPIAAPASTSVG